MLDALKFVQGAVAKKDFLPAMTHFAIEDGHVRAYNGVLALSSPIPFDIDCAPKAKPLVQAISKCEETVALSMTEGGKLRIQSGSFRAYVDCYETHEAIEVRPEGREIEVNGEEILETFKTLLPFVGDDASRPWSNGILLRNQSAFATNNVTVVERWLGSPIPFSANIPYVAVKEIVRLNSAPSLVQLHEHSITFHFESGRWVRSQLYTTDWPDLSPVLDRPSNPVEVPETLFTGIESLKPFVGKIGKIYFRDGEIATHRDDVEGAAFEIDNFPYKGCYQYAILLLLKGVATTADFSSYPEPCCFFGDKLRGVLLGMRY